MDKWTKAFSAGTAAETASALKARGFRTQGVLRRFVKDSDADYSARERRFMAAVCEARANGKKVEIIEHSLGKDWLVKD